jgi:hypothetical protein
MRPPPPAAELETDPRFPSGPWVGFWTQKTFPAGKHEMELQLTFQRGEMTGDGRDWVGPFLIEGKYDLVTGVCRFTKQYVGKHFVTYHGFNEGKGIWGKWEIGRDQLHGGFHIWPEGIADPTRPAMHEAANPPAPVERIEEPELVPA